MSWLEEKTQELLNYCPPLTRRPDFDEFWANTLRQAAQVALRPERRLIDTPSDYISVYDISYNGFDETRIHGWLILPRFAGKNPLPCVVQYHGFGGSRGIPEDHLSYVMLGCAVLAVDCRDQGGITGNAAAYSNGTVVNVVSKGLLDKNEFYYRAVYMDCVKAIDFACVQEEIDPERIIVSGGSQGGALCSAVSALDGRVKLALADVPSNSNLERRVEGAHGSFSCATEYIRRYPDQMEQVYETLSYFDTMNLADRIRTATFASVGLKDEICPALCYAATFNRIAAPKVLKIYPFNGHEGGQSLHHQRKLRFLKESGLIG